LDIPLWITGLQKLATLNVEGCNITAACFEYISGKNNHILFCISSFPLTLNINFVLSGRRFVMLSFPSNLFRMLMIWTLDMQST
jgi:hypothetical protein